MRNVSPSTVGSFTLALLLLLAPSALAHDTRLPLAADQLKIAFTGPGSPSIEFHFTGQGPILLGHDPRVEDTALLVYGTGVSGDSTGRLDLDPSLWTVVTDGGLQIVGYNYSDPAGASGVSSITLEHGNLSIIGDALTWPWNPAGGVDELWFHFLIEDEWWCAEGDPSITGTATNLPGRLVFNNAPAPFSCPDQVCGNGVREPGELCDDGNRVEGDGCSNDCQAAVCETPDFDSTFEGIQSIIFDSEIYGCNNAICHNPALIPAAGSLDLTPGNSHSQLVDVASSIPSADGVTFLDRVEPGEPVASFLIEKLEAKLFGTPTGGTPMPNVGPALTPQHLEAVDKWIRAGAPEHLVVPETAQLLGTCLPPEDPLKLDPPPAYPPFGDGVQFRSSAWPLPSNFEDEICFATYYDFTGTGLVPEEDQLDCPPGYGDTNNPSGKCFYYDRRILRQDAQSHHSIIHIYNGQTSITDPSGWGEFSYKPNFPNDPGAPSGPCDPTVVDPATGQHADCSGAVVTGVACTGYQPVDVATAAPSFAGSQEPFADNQFARGVFSILPMAGVIVWNSHAFNLSQGDSTMAHYLDLYFGNPNRRDFFAQGIFDADKIFIQKVPPFETREYCKSYTIPVGSNLFELNSHTHRWGTRFRIWGPPNQPCDVGGINVFNCEPNCGCQPGPPDQLLYFSSEYTDPVQLEINPPMTFGESVEDRTFLFCSLYDNGSTPESPPVKQQSLSPTSPPLDVGGLLLDVGGPCPDEDELYLGFIEKPGVMCMDGPNQGEKCGAQPNPASFCETAPGLGDGQCDACAVMGGVTTEDEMFILLGSFFIPEPSATALAAAALATLGALTRRRAGKTKARQSA